jgi:two-component system NtrC family sensor kinase
VYNRSLKTNIALQLAVVLFMAMILTAFVMIILMQKALVGSEMKRGYAFLSGISADQEIRFQSKHADTSTAVEHDFDLMRNDVGFSCILMMDEIGNPVFTRGKNVKIQGELQEIARQTLMSGKKTTRFMDSTWWGVWRQGQDMIISAPIIHEGKVVGASSVAVSLTGMYDVLKRTQYVLLIYILINTIVFASIGFYSISKTTVKPLHRLVKRAEAYQDDNEMFFLSENEDSEFNKLSRALNRMLQHIAEDKEKLQDAVVSLEKANFDLKKAQKDIIRAEKLASVGRLSAGIAHEIGNPIGIITGYLELLKREDVSNEDKLDFIVRTETEIRRIDSIIRQLLDLSRPSMDDVKEVPVHAVIEDAAGASRFHPSMSNIDLDLRLSAAKDRVKADPNQLRQVFLNLMINAADAILSAKSGAKGKISIISQVEKNLDRDSKNNKDMLRIDYIDNGSGISSENLVNIFDPFFTTKGPGKGTGLGLSVCFMIVEAMGGNIKATSKEGQGATFTVYLPLSADERLDNV